MRRSRGFVYLVVGVVGLGSCQGTSQQPPPAGRSGVVGASGAAPALARWAAASVPTGSAVRMDTVLAAVDRKVQGRRYSRIGSYRAVRRRPSGADRTRAPYFHVEGASGNQESLPLQSTRAKVDIAGVIARVTVTQVYRNRGKHPIEAVYVFPGSTRAAVHGMRMRIGERTIVARIDERSRARAAYNKARQAGQRASLLEQQRPNVFTMRVANIMPRDVIKVQLLYTELLVPEDGVYSFVYPSVVGPRNPMGAAPKSVGWVANPYLKSGRAAPYGFDVKVHLESPIGLKEVSSPSHPVAVAYRSRKVADVALKRPGGGNRDYVLRYRLAGDHIETGAMIYRDGKEQFFLAMVEPPKRVRTAQIPAREYIFVLDVSGSMYGFPLQTAKALMRDLLGKLRTTDLFNVVLFAGRAGTLNPRSLPATPENVASALGRINQIRGGGGTNLMDALRTSYGLPRPERRAISRSVVVVTDGYVAVEAQAFRYIQKRLNQANLFSFGIGSSVNRALIEGMARAGMGAPFVVLGAAKAPALAKKFREYVSSPVLTNIQVRTAGLAFQDVVPKKVPDLLAQRPLVVFGKLKGTGRGTLTISGVTGQGRFKRTLSIDLSQAKASHRPLRALWARKWAEMLMDQYACLGGDPEIQKAVTDLGLRYNLLTRFTSFVAIDFRVVNRSGKAHTVRQPLPLPAGVSDHAVATSARRRGRGGGGGHFAGRKASRMYRRSNGLTLRARPAPRARSLVDLLRPASGATAAESRASRGPRGRVIFRAVQNVSSQYVALARAVIRRGIRSCARSAGYRGRLVVIVDSQGRIRLQGGNATLRRCLLRRLARYVRLLTSRSGWIQRAGRSARFVISIR